MDLPYQQYFDAMPCYLSVQSPDYRIITANQRFRDHFGDWSGRHCYQVYKQRSEVCDNCPVERTFRDGMFHSSEEIVRTLGGREIAVLVNTTPIRDAAGAITAVMEMSTDITDIKGLQQRYRESRRRYRTLFEDVPCYISIQDADLRIVECNRMFSEDFGYHLGRHCYEAYKHRTSACDPCTVRKTFEDGQVHLHEEVVTNRRGETVNVLVHTAPVRDADGRITHVMEMSANITQIRQLESRLSSVGLLMSQIAHGIKGQLTGLDGGIYMVNSGLNRKDDARLRDGWAMVQRNVERIRSMVLDLLYYAKDREMERETIDAAATLQEVHETLSSRSTEHGVDLALNLEPGVGTFAADPKALRALLVNLVENSIDACRVDKRKDEHRVELTLSGDADWVMFKIADNGIGMEPETRDKAFSLFFTSKGMDGTGLGLFIAHKIAAAHGGRIALESEVNMGSTFTVILPRRPS